MYRNQAKIRANFGCYAHRAHNTKGSTTIGKFDFFPPLRISLTVCFIWDK
jgi:hypothetical protein